nr:helicase-associated domain-containing protein [Paenibacillus sp. NEAU-GSW1]
MLWELELIADRISADRMTVYRLNAASIARAVKHGRTAAGMAAFLKQASGMPLSALVVTLVDDWSAQADRLDLKELPDSAKHPLLAIAGTGSIALPFSDTIPLSPPAGMLSVDDWEQRLELLQEDRAAQQSVFPEMETVPVSWMRQLRAYHYTTRREMIERALKWQSPVQLQMEAGIVAFVPALLEADGDGWAVRGVLRESGECRQVRLTPGMWEEMRLVMPGMNGDR